ncbi:MAG: S8 family serine peptidase [Akkermansiaceae bacterium]|nr:S8 family serine peptidase [Akkermansiaceae bacterium]
MKNHPFLVPGFLLAVWTLAVTGTHGGAPALHGLTDPPVAVYPEPGDVPEQPVLQPNEEKLDHVLLSLVNASALLPGQSVADVKAEMTRLDQLVPEADVDDGTPYGPVNSDLLRVMVRFTALVPPDTPGTVAGPQFFRWDEQADWNVLFGLLEQDRLATVAAIPEVIAIDSVDPPRHRTAGGEGDALINGPTARSAYGVDGSVPLPGQNIRVGIISDGVTNLATAQASGDLPAVVNMPLGMGSGDEGTAMLEIVHEIAPGADLWFAPSGGTPNAHLTAATALATAGCNIIADDVGWYQEPYFESGFLGPSFANLMGMYPNLMFFSAAGNDAETHQQMGYIDAAAPTGLHDFPLWVNMPTGSSVDVYLQWNEPQGLPATGNYQLQMINNTTGSVVAWGTGSGTPYRKLQYTNSGSSADFHIEVMAINDTGAILEMFMDPKNGSTHYITNTSPVDAIFGHPGDPMVRAVTAVDYTTPAIIEFFASQGPWTQLFGGVAPKPDLTAPDGVSFSGAGGSHLPPYVGTTPPPYYFFGTSAATPHVAGVAALIWSSDPNQPRVMVDTALMSGATDLGTPGPDNVFGHGLVDALQSMISLRGPAPPTSVTATDGTLSDRVNVTWNAGVGADGYNVYASTLSDPGTAVPITPSPVTTLSHADFEQPLGFAIRDQTIHYWIEPFNNRFARPGDWSVVETGYLQPSNTPPSLVVPSAAYQTATRVPVAFGGISVSDLDAGSLPVRLILATAGGNLTVDTSVTGGVSAPQVMNNGTPAVTLTAPMSAINTTLALGNAVLYQSHPGVFGSKLVNCTADDLGNTGWGGPLTDLQSFNLTVFATRAELWQHERFPADVGNPAKEATVWGLKANPDKDLYDNEWEFFMNTDPNAATPAGQLTSGLSGGNFHILMRVGVDINPLSWMLESNPSLDPSGWAPSGASSTMSAHPDAPSDAMLWDLWVPYTPPAEFFRIHFDPGFVEP